MGVILQLPDLRPVWGVFETFDFATLRTSLTETNGQLRTLSNAPISGLYGTLIQASGCAVAYLTLIEPAVIASCVEALLISRIKESEQIGCSFSSSHHVETAGKLIKLAQ